MQISKQTFNTDQYTSQTNLSRALLRAPDTLSPAITHLAGRQDKRFPLSFLSQGTGNIETIGGNEYKYRVMVHLRKTRNLIVETAGSNVGQGFQQFELTFPDKWFIRDYTLFSPSGKQVRIMGDPSPKNGGYAYTVQIQGADASESIPASDLAAGATWAQGYSTVATDFSEGNASNWQAPAEIAHRLTTSRKSYHLSGASKNFVADFEFSIKGGKKSNLWLDWEEYQHMLNWMEECETMYWYGKRNYDDKGHTNMKDKNGNPIIIGPGLLEQIENKDYRSDLTANKLKDITRHIFFQMNDGENKVVNVYTGTGGAEDFDNAMKEEMNQNVYTQFNDGKFVSGSGREMTYGGYFTSYRHIDGHIINIVQLPLFDKGAVAEAARKHPRTGLPLESHRMVFVDQSVYDGVNNLRMVAREGRSMLAWAVSGSVVPNGYGEETNRMRASDIDGASVHFLKEAGIILQRYDTSFDLICDAA